MFLRKTLALAATWIRLSGSEAFVKIEVSVSDFPNRLAKRSQKDPGEELAEDGRQPGRSAVSVALADQTRDHVVGR